MKTIKLSVRLYLSVMILSINTTAKESMEIALIDEKEKFVVKKNIKTNHDHAEKLLPAIIKLLISKKINFKDIAKIKSANSGGSFTSLRIGVVTANALGYALGVPVIGEEGDVKKFGDSSIVEPVYDREPNITIKKQQ